MKCPMCEHALDHEELKTRTLEPTHFYTCPECPFVGFEYFTKTDTLNVMDRLK